MKTFREILKKSLVFTYYNKIIWLFSFFGSIFLINNINNIIIDNYIQSSNLSANYLIYQELFKNFQSFSWNQANKLNFLIAFILLAIIILFILIGNWAHIITINYIEKKQVNPNYSLKLAFLESINYYWKILFINIFYSLIITFSFYLLYLPLMANVLDKKETFSFLILNSLVFIISIIIFFLFNNLIFFINNEIINYQAKFLTSFKKGFLIIKQNFLTILKGSFILSLLNFILIGFIYLFNYTIITPLNIFRGFRILNNYINYFNPILLIIITICFYYLLKGIMFIFTWQYSFWLEFQNNLKNKEKIKF